MLVTGRDPGAFEIDHIDRDPTNNGWHNLRLATSSEQALNKGVRRDSTTGLRGVVKTKDKFQAKVQRGGVRTHIGTFSTPRAAADAYLNAVVELED